MLDKFSGDNIYNPLRCPRLWLFEKKNFCFQTKFFRNWQPSSAGLGWDSRVPTFPHTPTSTTWSSKARRPAGVAVTAPPCLDALRGPLSLRGLGRKGRGRLEGGSRLWSARSGEGPADCAGECAPTGPPAQPLAGCFPLGRLLPCSAPSESASASSSAKSCLPGDASRTPGPWELSWPRLCVPGAWVQLAADTATRGWAAWECPVSFDLGGPGEVRDGRAPG